MEALVEIEKFASIHSELGADVEHPEWPAAFCGACEGPMRQINGKWACVDESCGMCGVEQKLKRQK